ATRSARPGRGLVRPVTATPMRRPPSANPRKLVICLMLALAGVAGPARADEPLHDPNLPSVSPEAVQKLKDTRTRQDIMRHSLSRYPHRCVCSYQTQDSAGRSCKGRHEVVKTAPFPVC